MFQISKILFQTGDNKIFVQLKSSFSDGKTSTMKSETHFSIEAIGN